MVNNCTKLRAKDNSRIKDFSRNETSFKVSGDDKKEKKKINPE